MPQVQGDEFEGNPRLQEGHGTTVPPRVRSNPPANERGALNRCLAHGRGETERYAVMAQRCAETVSEDQFVRPDALARAPLAQPPVRFCPQGDLSILASFAEEMNDPVAPIPRAQWSRARSQ